MSNINFVQSCSNFAQFSKLKNKQVLSENLKSLTQKTKNRFPEGLKKKLYKKCMKFNYPKVAHHNKNIVCESEVLNI